jgi:hypothetical protein
MVICLQRNISLIIVLVLMLTLLSACQVEKPVAAAPEESEPVDGDGETSTDPLPKVYPVEELDENLWRESRPRPAPFVLFTGRVEHIFIHPLIPYPEKTFKSRQALGFDDWFITVDEFNRLLPTLYEKGFVLVRMEDVYEEYTLSGRTMIRRKDLRLPEGKRPLILSIDDLNYYEYMIQSGLVHKLVLDDKGEVTTYGMSPEGNEVISRENDVVPILDDYVKKHPDFSYKGAKGIIALTGFEGILGYRTQASNPNHQSEREAVAPVVERLKATGWTFASHSYGHPNMTTMSYNYLVSDTLQWKREVEPLVGPTFTLIYPFGARVQEGSDKFRYLIAQGFRVFAAVGPSSHEKISTQYGAVMTDRRSIDGITLRDRRHQDLFDPDYIIDLSVRPRR